jgi:tetratricopeptide (TPR) repeat protein
VNQVNGHPDEAAEAYAKVLEIRRAIHGDEHLALAKPLNNIGALAFARGDYETAIEHYGQALRLYENIYGETHAEIARMLKNRGHAYLRARRYEEATADLERGLAVAGSIWGENDPDLGLLCALLGDAYTGMKELDKAQAVLERGLDLRKGGESPWELALLRSVLGEVLWRRGTDRKRAVELVKQAEAWFAEDPAKRKRGLSSTRAWLGGQREWREDRPTL